MSRLSRIHSDLDRLFEEAMRLVSREPRAGEHEPPADVVETEGEVVVLVEVPGVAADDLELAIEGRVVVLTGTKSLRPPEDARRFHGVEREQGRFELQVELLAPVNTHQGRARLENGVLTVAFPKVEEKRTVRRPIEIAPIEDGEDGESAEGETGAEEGT